MIYHITARSLRAYRIPFEATRYHSLIVEKRAFPSCLEVIAWTKENEIMGAKASALPGVGRAVPSGVHPDRSRQGDAGELPSSMIKEAIAQLVRKENLDDTQMQAVMH